MSDRRKSMLDVEFGIEVLEHLVVELSVIIDDNYMGKPKSIDDKLSKKLLTLLSIICTKSFALSM